MSEPTPTPPSTEPNSGSLERLPTEEATNAAIPVEAPNGAAPKSSANRKSSGRELARLRQTKRRVRALRRKIVSPFANWAKHRTELIAILIALITSACFLPHVLQFSSRNEADREIIPWLPMWQGLERLEYQLYDARFIARGPVQPFSIKKIAIVAMDDTSLEVIKEWPWPRDEYAKLVRRLKKAGARVIVLDINFSDKQFPNDDGSMSRMDKELIAAVSDAGNVIMPSGFRFQRKRIDQDGASSSLATFLTTPFEELDAATPDLAVNYLPPDIDGGNRLYAVHGTFGSSQLGSLSALAAGMYQKMLDGDQNTRFYQTLTSARWPALNKVDYGIPQAKVGIGENELWMTPIYFWGPAGTFPTYSFSDVLKSSDKGYSDAGLISKFKDRIVFVGATADVLKDNFKIPSFSTGVFDTATGQEETTNQISGVELHASVTAMMLDGKYIYSDGRASNVMFLFGITLAAALWMVLLRRPVSLAATRAQLFASRHNWRFRVHSLVWFGLYAGLGGLVNIAFWQFCKSAFIYRDMWIVAVYPSLSAALAGALTLLTLFGVETAERRKTTTQMGRFVSPAIMDEILAHPEEEYPRSRRCNATVIFTDLEGFTSFSENHEPEEVVETLNAYMSRMVPIVHEYGGEVDKYIGDAIMGFFGVPVPRYDHAARALLCAIAMQDECARFREETGIAFYMRVGIHTGDVIAGCMGSDDGNAQRLNYTVIGDTVNLASRLESKNKEFSSWIMCSAATYEAAPDIVEVEAVSTPIKGKSQAVDVLIVRGLKGDPEYDKRWGRQLDAGEADDSLSEGPMDDTKALESPVLALPSGQTDATVEK